MRFFPYFLALVLVLPMPALAWQASTIAAETAPPESMPPATRSASIQPTDDQPAAKPVATRPTAATALKAEPQLSREARARQAQQDAEVERAAREVMALVDAGKLDEAWEGASAIIRRLVPHAAFASQVEADRKRLGPVLARGKPWVERERYAAGGRVPQGEYLNVITPTRFANAPAPVRELVSFRLDEDRVWRLSGYSLR